MSGLVLKLGPGERLLVNGAVIENGERRSRFSILTPEANILRLRDAIRPGEANTPVRRVCYIAQLVLSGDVPAPAGHAQILSGIEQLSQVFRDADSRALLAAASQAAVGGESYRALKRLRALLPREERMFRLSPDPSSNPPPGAS
ncbi:flagellar biosynthesis repressor FlbT [Limimaricola sp. G21655-S1]|uniref:flagellar biosynthesis repressor FlbT n=1 Tax=unclassified Limimaricola TaxID=2626459 RepID=UPI0022AE84B0|nr:flagellar biosynthesis repressor FlbT [Limimaricola sp. G21655-S1]MCZ4261392.1 flagellar biosynthesis repressor FlbT [Limimaricola sp. G21655-S1]